MKRDTKQAGATPATVRKLRCAVYTRKSSEEGRPLTKSDVYRTGDGRAVLIFTGYSDTMVYLRDALVGAFGMSVACYSGEGGALRSGNGWVSASKEIVTKALRDGTVKVLVCTDAASEGLNLQAAGALVNFDLELTRFCGHPEA